MDPTTSLSFPPPTATHPNVNANANVNVNVNVNVNTNMASTDYIHNNGVTTEATDTTVAIAASSSARTVTTGAVPSPNKEYIKIQNDKKFTMFTNLLNRCEGVSSARALASNHGVPQVIARRKLPLAELLSALGNHKTCTDFCLISVADAILHGINAEECFSAKELRNACQVLGPRITNKRKRVDTLQPGAEKRVTSEMLRTAAESGEWPELLTWSQKKDLLHGAHSTMTLAAKDVFQCSLCGTEFHDHVNRSHITAELDMTVLEEATAHVRSTLKVPSMISHDVNADGTISVCQSCSKSISKGKIHQVPLFSYANGCWIGTQPSVLSDLTYVESIAIARARGTKCFIKLEKGPFGQSAALGNVCVLPQEPKYLATVLPPPIHELTDEIAVVFVSDADASVKEETLLRSPLLLRRGRVLAALKWLQENNPLYEDVVLSVDHLEQYPEHGALNAPTQHMLASTALSSEGASYTTYSGQANLEAFAGNDGPVPVLSQGMLDLDVVADTYRDRKLQAIIRLKQGLDPFIKYPSGGTPLSTSYSPDTWAYLWPTLFPYGVGAFDDSIRLDAAFGLRRLHVKTHVQKLLHLHDRRFCTHPAFIFVMANVLQRKASSFSATLATKRSWFRSVQDDLQNVSVDVVTSLQQKLEKDPAYVSVAEDEKTCFRLLQKLRFLSEPVSGSTGEVAAYREEIRATCRVLGLPHLYVTLNPADCHHPIAQVFCGRATPIVTLPAHARTSAIDSAERRARAMAVAANPVAGAKFFHFMMTTFLNHILGDGTAPGIFGNAAAHYGIVEAQDRGSLHCHMLIWLKGGLSPLQIQEKSQQNREWADKYLAWLEDVIKMDWPAILPGADGSGLVYSESPTMYLSPSPTDSDFDNIWPVYLRNLLQKTGQNHEHGHTCYKHLPKSLRALRDADKDCRFRLPRPLVPQSSFDEDGHVQLKCSNGMMNGYNDVVVSAMGCNMDCKAIGSGTAAMAMIHYITNYISKMGFDSGLVLAALAGSMKAMESSASQPAAASSSTEDANAASDESTLNVRNLDTSTQSRTRLLLLKTVNQMIGKRKLSGQQVSSYLCGNPNRYTALKFEKFYWGSLLRTVLPDFYPSYVPPEGVPSVSGQEGEAETDPLTVVRSENDSVTQNRAPSTLAEDYAWRHEDLKDITLWQFMSDYVKRPKPRSKSSQASPMLDGTIPHHPEQVDVEVDVDQLLREEAEGDREELVEQDEVMTTRSTWPFRCGHYAAESHVLRKRTTPVVPVLMGPGLPRRDREEELDKYQATMLLMFKPWSLQQSIQLKEQDETWKLAFDNFLAGTDPAVLRLMNNMQQMHECRDAKDDHSAQRKAREAALRGNTSIFADGLGDGDSNDDDEIWLAAMQTTATEPTEQRDSETYADALTQRAIDYAAVAGFYDVQETPDSAEDVVDHANVVAATSEDVERAERHLRALLKQKEDKIKQRTATAPASTRAFRPRMAAGTEGLPHATTWAAQVEAIRKKYEGIRFGNVPWRRLKDYQKTCLTLIELYTLNEEQTLAFLLICDNEGRRLGTSDVDPLGLLIGGPGGTGKSQIFMAVEDFFEICSAKHKLKLTAPTGVAASNIGGATIHSEASLRVPRLSMKTERLRTALEERWRSATTCVVDEVSFLGASDMALLNEYLKLAKGGRSDTYFGGLDMIFVGDMAQLPPPMSRALFDGYLSSVTNVNAGNDGERRALSGIAAFRSINKAVVLKQVMRQKDSSFVALLGRLRYGMCTREDKDLLDQYVLGSGSLARASNIDPSLWVTSPENASPLISYRNGVRDAHNDLMAKAFAQTSNQQFHYYHSEDKIGKGRAQRTLQNMAARAAWDVAAKKAGDLSGRLPLLMGMPVFCTENIATELGISNGSEGVVAGVSYSTSTGRRIAISADVDFPAYQNPDRAADFPHRVVLVPVKAPFTYSLPGSDAVYSATRWQLPLIPAFAYTCHNSQGRSLTTATIDLESASVAKDKTPLAYVMLSRLRSLEGLTILRPFPFAVISTHASHQVRTELKRVQDLASATSDWAKEKLSWYYDKRSDDSSV